MRRGAGVQPRRRKELKDTSMKQFDGTTIVSVRRNGKVAIAGDGQVSMGNTVMKGNAKRCGRCPAAK